jgi:CelD/BcsL family acetyltransferase involved in cellulose biosynthesis
MVHTELLCDVDSLVEVRRSWDELAVERRKPFCCPAWMLAWWHHAAPPNVRLRVITVWEGGDLIGIAPFYEEIGWARTVQYRLLAGSTSARIEPLARRGRDRDVARLVARALGKVRPHPSSVRFDGIERASRWPDALTTAWPDDAHPWVQREMSMPAPTLSLYGDTFEEWWQRRSSRFRREFRRRRRRLEEAGATFRLASTPSELSRGLAGFASMHYDRWRWRGGSMALDPAMERMLEDVARELATQQRFRLWMIEIDEKVISSQIFIGAGGELSYWLGGFDESWAAQGPSIQAVLSAIEHAWSVGDERIDFGAGGQSYKYSFADGQDAIESVTIVPRGSRYALQRLQLLPSRLQRSAQEQILSRLSQQSKDRLKRRLRQLSRLG